MVGENLARNGDDLSSSPAAASENQLDQKMFVEFSSSIGTRIENVKLKLC